MSRANLRHGGRRKIAEGELWCARIPGLLWPVRVRVIRWAGTLRDPAWRVGILIPGASRDGTPVFSGRYTISERDLLYTTPAAGERRAD